MDTVTEQLSKCDLWYVQVLLSAIEKQLYSNAGGMFDALKRAEPTIEGAFAFDDAELESYQRTINHSRQFREDGQFIVETDEKEVYLSNGQLVKAWLNVSPSKDDPALGYKVLHFLRQIEKIRSVAPDYLPNIHEFGIATKSSSLYLVTDKAEGDQWDHFSLNAEEKLLLIERLITVIEHLHGLGMSHGDLHPANIIVNPVDDDFRITLIDIPDFSVDQDEPKNHRYSPDNIDSCTAFERDIFAVMRLSPGRWPVARPGRLRCSRWGSLLTPIPHLPLEGLADQPHNIRQFFQRGETHFHITVAPAAHAGNVLAHAARVGNISKRHIQRKTQPLCLRYHIDKVGLGLVGHIELEKLLTDYGIERQHFLAKRFEQFSSHTTEKVRMILYRIARG